MPSTLRLPGAKIATVWVEPVGPSVTTRLPVAAPGFRVNVALVFEVTTIEEIESPFVPGVENNVAAVSESQSEPALPVALTETGTW